MHLLIVLFHYDLLAFKASYTIYSPSVDGMSFHPPALLTPDCLVISSLYQLLCICNQFSEIFKLNKFFILYLHISGKYKVE